MQVGCAKQVRRSADPITCAFHVPTVLWTRISYLAASTALQLRKHRAVWTGCRVRQMEGGVPRADRVLRATTYRRDATAQEFWILALVPSVTRSVSLACTCKQDAREICLLQTRMIAGLARHVTQANTCHKASA